MLNLTEHPHRRYNPLTGEWVLVSPHRTKRPWQGQVEAPARETRPPYDPACYLCPGNSRAGGVRNPNYNSTFVFDNDYAALLPETPREQVNRENLLIASGEPGICRVVCFSPRHDLTLSGMSVPEVEQVIDTWAEQFDELGSREDISYVQIFENRGAMMGASNPHPHCQIWGTADLPNEVVKEQHQLTSFQSEHRECLLCEYTRLEESSQERLVLQNDSFSVVVPFWAVWPFETMVLARQHVGNITQLATKQRTELANALTSITAIYDRVFDAPFPYTMGFHQTPTDGNEHPEWHFHAHFYPPLLRSATIRKFMVGYEMLATPQRDITPEQAAERLKALAEATHGGAS